MKKLIYAIAAFAILAVSCNKTTPLPLPQKSKTAIARTVNSTLTIENGIMHFTDAEALQNTILSLQQMSETELDDFTNGHSDFISLYKQYQLLDEQAENETGMSASSTIEAGQITDIPDDYFARVINYNGLLMVGDEIYRYLPNEFQVTDLPSYQHPDFEWSTIARKGFGQANYGNDEWASFPPVSRIFYKDDGGNFWPKHNGREVRAIHTKWCSWFGVYASAGAKIKLEKKSKYGGWINIDHASASNTSSSEFRYFTKFTGNGNTWWAWNYYPKYGNKNTANSHINEIVLTGHASVPVGPLQHKVNDFISTVSITRQGSTLNSTWIH